MHERLKLTTWLKKTDTGNHVHWIILCLISHKLTDNIKNSVVCRENSVNFNVTTSIITKTLKPRQQFSPSLSEHCVCYSLNSISNASSELDKIIYRCLKHLTFDVSPRRKNLTGLNIDRRVTKVSTNDRYYIYNTGLKSCHCQSKMAAKNPRWLPRNLVFLIKEAKLVQMIVCYHI